MENQNIIIQTEFQGIILNVKPDEKHKWLLTTEEVANGYGVSIKTVREHKRTKLDELEEDLHFITARNSGGNPRAGIPHIQTLWTREGVIMLGFFIKSERAKIFRKWASKLILNHLEEKKQTQEIDIEALEEKLLQRVENKLIHNLKQDLLEATQTFIHTHIEENNQTQMYRYWEYLQGVFELLDQRLKKIEPPKIEKNTKKAYVYVFQKIGTEEYKIGKSIQTLQRLQRIQTNAGNKIQLLMAIDMPNEATALKLEEYLQFVFEEKRIIGEWFRLNQADLALIRTIAQGFENYKLANP